MTLTFDLWPWKQSQQCPHNGEHFTEIRPLRTEMLCHARQVLTDGRTDAQKTQCLHHLLMTAEAQRRYNWQQHAAKFTHLRRTDVLQSCCYHRHKQNQIHGRPKNFFQGKANYGYGDESPSRGTRMEPGGVWGKSPRSRRQLAKIMHK